MQDAPAWRSHRLRPLGHAHGTAAPLLSAPARAGELRAHAHVRVAEKTRDGGPAPRRARGAAGVGRAPFVAAS